jgi:para-nitrobenzyl esterase
MVTPEEGARGAYGLLKQLDVSPNNMTSLRDVPAATLIKTWRAYVASAGGGDYARPVVDGRSMAVHPFEPVAAEIMKTTPLLIGTCETELTFALGSNPKNFTLSDTEARLRMQRFIKISESETATLFGQFQRNHPQANPSDLMFRISTDQMYRRNDILAAERKAAQGGAPAYMYLFTWKTPVLDGKLQSPHTMCIPFVFGTVDVAAAMLGTAPERYQLMQRVMGAWVAFARTGNPNHSGLPQWMPYSAGNRSTMIFDNDCSLVNDPARDDRLALEPYPLYSADGSSRLY